LFSFAASMEHDSALFALCSRVDPVATAHEVQALLALGASPSRHPTFRDSPLSCAIERCNYPVVVTLLAAGAELEYLEDPMIKKIAPMIEKVAPTTLTPLPLFWALSGLDDFSPCGTWFEGPEHLARAHSLVQIIQVLLQQPGLHMDRLDEALLTMHARRHVLHGQCMYNSAMRVVLAERDARKQRWSPLRAAFIGAAVGCRVP
jgi:hypothetical protein